MTLHIHSLAWGMGNPGECMAASDRAFELVSPIRGVGYSRRKSICRFLCSRSADCLAQPPEVAGSTLCPGGVWRGHEFSFPYVWHVYLPAGRADPGLGLLQRTIRCWILIRLVPGAPIRARPRLSHHPRLNEEKVSIPKMNVRFDGTIGRAVIYQYYFKGLARKCSRASESRHRLMTFSSLSAGMMTETRTRSNGRAGGQDGLKSSIGLFF